MSWRLRRRAGAQAKLIVDCAIAGTQADARLSLRLVDRHSGLILWAEDYPFDASHYDRSLAHVASNVHADVETLSLGLRRNGQERQSRAAREEYESVLALTGAPANRTCWWRNAVSTRCWRGDLRLLWRALCAFGFWPIWFCATVKTRAWPRAPSLKRARWSRPILSRQISSTPWRAPREPGPATR
jgi:hypothetical protein